MSFPLRSSEFQQRTQALVELRAGLQESLEVFTRAHEASLDPTNNEKEMSQEFHNQDYCVDQLNSMIADLTRIRNQVDAAVHLASAALFSHEYEESLAVVELNPPLPTSEGKRIGQKVGTREDSNASILPHIYGDPVKAKAFRAAKSEFASELSWQADCTDFMAHRIITNSVSLLHMPEMESFYLSGNLAESRLTDVVSTTEDLHPEDLLHFDRDMMDYLAPAGKPIPQRSARDIRKKANVLREVLHRESLTERRNRDAQKRAVYLSTEINGLATLTAHLPAEAAHAVMNTLTDVALCSRSSDDPRTLAQTRADVLTDLVLQNAATPPAPARSRETAFQNSNAQHGTVEPRCDESSAGGSRNVARTSSSTSDRSESAPKVDTAGTTNHADLDEAITFRGIPADDLPHITGIENGDQGRYEGHPPETGRIPAKVTVTIPYDVLLGLRDGFANLDGYGPIPADVARKLAANAPTLYRVITDPETDLPLEYQRDVYRVSSQVRDYLLQRTDTCEFPGCNVSARRTDADHIDAWDSGGETVPNNLQLLCRKHHNLKTHRNWQSKRMSDGSVRWTSPLGNVCFTHPTPSAPPGTKALTVLTRPPTPASAHIRFDPPMPEPCGCKREHSPDYDPNRQLCPAPF